MFELRENIFSVGVQNPELEVFDIIMKTPMGTSYNAYLVKGTEKTALVETAKEGFLSEYIKNIEEIMPFSDIDYLIINHTEPDHAGIIPDLLQKNQKLQVIGTASAITFIGQIINRDFNSRVVKKGDTLDLGGRELRFYPMPNLHWPDTMFTYDTLSNGVFTCDFLGAHHAYAPLLLSTFENKKDYLVSARKYYQDIMAPFAQPFVKNGVKAIRELKPDIVFTGHGAVLDVMIEDLVALYDQMSDTPQRDGKSVAIIYVSAYGYTKMLGTTIKEEIEKAGIKANIIELTEHNRADARAAIAEADAVLFGSPTFLGDLLDPIGELLAALYPFVLKGKLCSAFGSYGWTGEAVPNIMARLQQLKAKTVEGVRARLRPNEEELASARALAAEIVKGIQ
ncbi:MAG: FprA family A-type flavoprotein [Clostridiales bacterium]|nr:FprA family A-type flavoprotein [Clostridiales bacterium]